MLFYLYVKSSIMQDIVKTANKLICIRVFSIRNKTILTSEQIIIQTYSNTNVFLCPNPDRTKRW